MRSSNPVLNEKTFKKYKSFGEGMTLQGTLIKTIIMTLLLLCSASITWNAYYAGSLSIILWTISAAIVGFVLVLVTSFIPKISFITAPLYALIEGVFVGGISAIIDDYYPGLAIQAVLVTVGILLVMLILYMTRTIVVTDKLRKIIIIATVGIFFVYLISFILNLFGITVPYIHESGIIGILFSLFVVGVASFNLLLDFDFIETNVRAGAPKFMEWFSGMGMIITIVWLYVEVLKLLSKLKERQ